MHRFCQAPSLLHPEIKNCHIKSLFPATRQSAIFSQSLQPCQAFRLDSSSVCDGSQKNGGFAGKRFYWLARFPAGHETARQVSSGRKCVAFPVAVHLIFRSAPFLLLMPVFYFRFFSQKSLPYRKQCVALRRWAGFSHYFLLVISHWDYVKALSHSNSTVSKPFKSSSVIPRR